MLFCTFVLVLPIRFARKLHLRSARVCRSGETTGASWLENLLPRNETNFSIRV
jgi:hypothetical protein